VKRRYEQGIVLILVVRIPSGITQVYVVASQQLDITPPVMVVKKNARYDNAPLLSSSGQQLGVVTYITQGLPYIDAGGWVVRELLAMHPHRQWHYRFNLHMS
jgi:hypothetical protein